MAVMQVSTSKDYNRTESPSKYLVDGAEREVEGIGIGHEESAEEQNETVTKGKVLCERLHSLGTRTHFACQRYLATVVAGRRPIFFVRRF